MFLSLNAYYAVQTDKCSDAIQKIGTVVWLSSLVYQHKQQETTGNTRPTWTYPLRSHGHMVGESTCVVNIGILPAPTFGTYECDTWSITKFTQWDNQGFPHK